MMMIEISDDGKAVNTEEFEETILRRQISYCDNISLVFFNVEIASEGVFFSDCNPSST